MDYGEKMTCQYIWFSLSNYHSKWTVIQKPCSNYWPISNSIIESIFDELSRYKKNPETNEK